MTCGPYPSIANTSQNTPLDPTAEVMEIEAFLMRAERVIAGRAKHGTKNCGKESQEFWAREMSDENTSST